MPSIVFWAGVGGGTEQYRCRTPGAALERAGWKVTYTNGCDLEADVVVVQRVLDPELPSVIRALQAAGTFVVYDIDDWYDGLPGYNPASKTIGPDELELLHESLRAVDLITVTTAELAEGYAPFNRTVVLPNYLDPRIWAGTDHLRFPYPKVRVGWMGSALWRSADVDVLKPWLSGWLKRHPDVEFVAAGSDANLLRYLGVEGLLCPPQKGFIRPYEHLPAMLAWFDVGLVPLAHNRFNQAKSWCKGMEYNAMGVPAVASPSREYRQFIRPGINGYLVRSGNWQHALEQTLDGLDGLREGARKVAAEHMIDDHIDRWIDAYGKAGR